MSPALSPRATCDAGAVADAELDRHRRRPVSAPGSATSTNGVLLRVVGDRRLGHEQRVGVLLEDDLGVGRHVGLELLARVVDRDLDLEGGDVVLLDADRRDLRDLAVEDLSLEGLDA